MDLFYRIGAGVLFVGLVAFLAWDWRRRYQRAQDVIARQHAEALRTIEQRKQEELDRRPPPVPRQARSPRQTPSPTVVLTQRVTYNVNGRTGTLDPGTVLRQQGNGDYVARLPDQTLILTGLAVRQFIQQGVATRFAGGDDTLTEGLTGFQQILQEMGGLLGQGSYTSVSISTRTETTTETGRAPTSQASAAPPPPKEPKAAPRKTKSRYDRLSEDDE